MAGDISVGKVEEVHEANELPLGFVVYAISDGHRHNKIGVASNVSRRMKELQTGSPRRLLLSSYVECDSQPEAFSVESAAKRSLDEFRTIGEWFRCDSYYAIQALHEGADEVGARSRPVMYTIAIDNPPAGDA